MLRWTGMEPKLILPPGVEVIRPKKKRYEPQRSIELLDPYEVRALMDACSNPRRRRQYPTGIRNRAWIALAYRTALRCAETLDLRLEDLSEDRGTVLVRRGKGGKRRVVGMDQGGFDEVNCWLEVRPPSEWLFCTLQGGKLDSGYMRAMLKRKQARTGIKRRVHPHGMRHTAAGEMALEGIPLPVIQAQLGHAKIATTGMYLRGIAPEAMISAIRQRQWKR